MSDVAAPSPRRRLIVALPLVVFAALAVLFVFRLYSGDPSVLPSALIGRPAPALELPPVEGLKAADGSPSPGLMPADLATGQPTVVNVWASWCGPCRVEHPVLLALKERGIHLVGINYKDAPDNATSFLGALGNPFAKVGADPKGRAAIEWGVYGVPETFVVDGKGRIVFKHVGPLSKEAVVEKLLPAIEAAKKAG